MENSMANDRGGLTLFRVSIPQQKLLKSASKGEVTCSKQHDHFPASALKLEAYGLVSLVKKPHRPSHSHIVYYATITPEGIEFLKAMKEGTVKEYLKEAKARVYEAGYQAGLNQDRTE
jgi:hypothetical protein